MALRVLLVIPSFFPSEAYGGPATSFFSLVSAVARQGRFDVRVHTTNADGHRNLPGIDPTRDYDVSAGVRARYFPRVAGSAVSPALLGALAGGIRWADIIHLVAVYSFPTLPTLLLARHFRKPLLWSPVGSLLQWEGTRRRMGKRLWVQSCRHVLPRRTFLHCASEEESMGSGWAFPTLPRVVIPPAVSVPPAIPREHHPQSFRLLFLGRLDPIKGLEQLLDACALLRDWSVPWTLVIAGAGPSAYAQSLRDGVARLALSPRVTFRGAVSGQEKRQLFHESDVVLVPSHRESFCRVVAEALGESVPVIVSRAVPWREVERVGCGLQVDNTPTALAEAIRRMWELPRDVMGARGRTFVQERFRADRVASLMTDQYRLLAGRGAVTG